MFRLLRVVVFVAALATSNALSVPHDAVSLTSQAEQQDCDLRLWVRADDLSPSTIVEGDVRLLNNMSGLSTEAASACQILDWSLHLRYRERAAIKVPLSNINLPKKPVYNYTWESNSWGNDDYRVDQVLSEGGDVSSLFETVVNPHQSELDDYQRQLEEYVRAVSSADKWIIREDEVTLFEAVLHMPHPIEVVDDLQQAIASFGIAVPAVIFPEAASRQTMWFSDEDVAEKIMYSDETDMSYFAKLHLSNGSTVDVNGGRTKFFTPGRNETITFKTTEVPLLQKKPSRGCGESVYCATDGALDHGLTNQEIKDDEPTKQLSAIIEAPTKVVRGRKVTIKGRISSDEYIPTRIWIGIHAEREKVWGHDQIAKAGSVTSRNKTDLTTNFALSSWGSSEQREDHSSALYLEDQLKRHLDDFDDDTGSDYFGGSWCHRRSDKGLAIKLTDNGSFEMEYTWRGDSFGSGSTFFAEHKAAFTIKVEARSILEQEDAETQEVDCASEEVLSIHQKFHNNTSDWIEYFDHDGTFGRSLLESKGVLTLEGKIPMEGFLNEMMTLKKRDPVLASLLDGKATGCKSQVPPLDYLQKGALAPVFVDISDQDKIANAASLVDPCAKLSQSFPPVNTMPISLQHIPASIRDHSMQAKQTEGDVKYRKTKYPLRDSFNREECWRKPGSCGGAAQDVGTVWVNRVMLPKLKLEENAKENRAEIKAPFLVVQG